MITHMLHFREQIIKINKELKEEKSLFNERYKLYLKRPDYIDTDDYIDADDDEVEQIIQSPHRHFTLAFALVTTIPQHLYNASLWMQFMTRRSPLSQLKLKITRLHDCLLRLANNISLLKHSNMKNLFNQLNFKARVIKASGKDEIKEQITQYLCNLELITQLFDAENPEYLAFIKARSGDDDSILMPDDTDEKEGDKEHNHPHEFLCPISQELMKNPSLTQYGHSYEKKNISVWLKSHDTDPTTGVILSDKTLRPNQQLKQAISRYKKEKEAATLNE